MSPRWQGFLTTGLLCMLFTGLAYADVFRPAYLQLRQTGPVTYEVVWKVPALDESTMLRVRPLFPDGTTETAARQTVYAAGATVQRWQVLVPGGLEGNPIVFDRLRETGIDVLVRVERLDGSEQLERILPVEPQFVLRASPGALEVIRTYTILGIEHILLGFDHLLFVLALVLLVQGVRRLVLTITAFTLAHSLTLALATLGFVHLPGPPVEAIIALSIVFVASEILHRWKGREGLAVRKPWIVAFAFGLLHGLGFAGALAEVGLPQNAIPLALLFFNVGVEIGQLLFVAATLLVIEAARRMLSTAALERTPVFVAYGIGALASFWLVERTAAFWG